MDFGIFYDNGPETHCNVNAAGQPTGQMYGGYYVGLGPAGYHNGAFYSDPRISAYIGMGLHQMPGNVWWRSWRELPPKAPFADCQATDPDFSWQGQWPMTGYWQTYTDPQSGQQFPVWEGHYTYPGSSLTFIPTWAGGMFEALMANEVVPETSWGTHSFGLADERTVDVQMKYATEALHYPVWGLSPSSTADDSGGYGGFGVEGLLFPYYGFGADATNPNEGLSQCHGCATEDVVTPHASFLALDPAPQQAYANIQALRRLYPAVYGVDGFFDAVNPTTGAVGHRYLVLDQSMIMAALDNALANRALQRDFAADPVSWAAQTYLELETMSLG
jgi:Putative glucoamylase